LHILIISNNVVNLTHNTWVGPNHPCKNHF